MSTIWRAALMVAAAIGFMAGGPAAVQAQTKPTVTTLGPDFRRAGSSSATAASPASTSRPRASCKTSPGRRCRIITASEFFRRSMVALTDRVPRSAGVPLSICWLITTG
jgi:hypothetical protein